MKDTEEKFIRLYHATEQANILQIAKKGLVKGTCLGTDEIVDYYREDMGQPVTLVCLVTKAALEKNFKLDGPSLEEPITTVLGYDEDEIFEQWEDSNQTVMDALEITGAVKSKYVIKPKDILIEINCEEMLLTEYIKKYMQEEFKEETVPS